MLITFIPRDKVTPAFQAYISIHVLNKIDVLVNKNIQ